jgi:hypothetical protein
MMQCSKIAQHLAVIGRVNTAVNEKTIDPLGVVVVLGGLPVLVVVKVEVALGVGKHFDRRWALW